MDERDAKAQGLEVHRRDMAFVRGYVTCTTCACNYHCADDRPGHRVPTYCQRYGIHIDPAATDANILRAEACDQWVHEALDRNVVVHPDHAYRYDKWQEVSLRMTADQRDRLTALGGAKWVRSAIDAAQNLHKDT